MKTKLIAPCGMNCNLCSGYLREKDRCLGCADAEKKYCINCIIRNCKKNLRFCSDKCDTYPCKRLKNLDKRYKTRYKMSMIENLEYIRENGIRKFVKNEKKRWMKGKKVFCVHNKKYYDIK